jgi:hypothetical protein
MNTDKQITVYTLIAPDLSRYVGQTSQPVEKRFRYYRNIECHTQKKLLNALTRFGPENFTFTVLKQFPADQQVEADQLEQSYIEYWDTISRGYNTHRGGHYQNDLAKMRMSAALKNRYAAIRELNGGTGTGTRKPLSDSHKAAMSAGKRGKPRNPESTLRMVQTKLAKRQARLAEAA